MNAELVNKAIDCVNEHLLPRWEQTDYVVPQAQVIDTVTAHTGDGTKTVILLLEKMGRLSFDRVQKVYDLQSSVE